MGSKSADKRMRTDVGELILFDNSSYVGDTFVFEPAPEEEKLGWLFAAGETEDRDGVGREFLDAVVNALQREYYRDPKRGMLSSFESALHQVNLVLYELTEKGVREWMSSFHMAAGVLGGTSLHVSTVGEGVVLLVRRARASDVSAGLSRSPIVDPLRTFSQVASGIVNREDVLFVGTSQFENIFKYGELPRLIIDHSAEAITSRLKRLYQDQGKTLPVASLVISLLPQYAAQGINSEGPDGAYGGRAPISPADKLRMRAPLNINRSIFKQWLLLLGRILSYSWLKLRQVVWPQLKEGSRRSGTALFKVSLIAGRNVKSLTAKKMGRWKEKPSTGLAPTKINLPQVYSWPKKLAQVTTTMFKAMPSSSKMFAVLALILAIALTTSLFLLQKKRIADLHYQEASELLHEARTKKEAADTSLIYDNREQARSLVFDARELIERLKLSRLYQEEAQELEKDVTSVQDRLDKVTRVSNETTDAVGDFSTAISRGSPTRLYYLNDNLFTFDPANNVIVKMDKAGSVNIASETTQGIGFFDVGTVQEADKMLVLATDEPGMAVYDAKIDVLDKQEISFPSSEPKVLSIATFGNRLYLYDRAANNIYGYSKTLRGYSGGNAWITDEEFPRDTIVGIGVDGYIYTLHEDGTINKLLKGVPVEFELEQVEPAIPGTARMYINENIAHLYVFDPGRQRVVVFDTKGNLNEQIFLDEQAAVVDIAVDSEETTLYILAGKQVKAVSLKD